MDLFEPFGILVGGIVEIMIINGSRLDKGGFVGAKRVTVIGL
jgi:hypothetical protein